MISHQSFAPLIILRCVFAALGITCIFLTPGLFAKPHDKGTKKGAEAAAPAPIQPSGPLAILKADLERRFEKLGKPKLPPIKSPIKTFDDANKELGMCKSSQCRNVVANSNRVTDDEKSARIPVAELHAQLNTYVKAKNNSLPDICDIPIDDITSDDTIVRQAKTPPPVAMSSPSATPLLVAPTASLQNLQPPTTPSVAAPTTATSPSVPTVASQTPAPSVTPISSPSATNEPAAPPEKHASAKQEDLKHLEDRLGSVEQSEKDIDRRLRQVTDSLTTAQQDLQRDSQDQNLRLVNNFKPRIESLETGIRTVWVSAIVAAVILLLAIFLTRAKRPRQIKSTDIGDISRFEQEVADLRSSLQSSATAAQTHAQSIQELRKSAISAESLNNLEKEVHGKLGVISGNVTDVQSELAGLKALLILPASERAAFQSELQGKAKQISSPATILIQALSNLQDRLRLDSFRKLLRSTSELSSFENSVEKITRTRDEAVALLKQMPSQLFRWDRVRYESALERLQGLEREADNARRLLAGTVRNLLPAYRSVALRDPLPQAIQFAKDFVNFEFNGAALKFVMICDGAGVSADPADAAANWHIRGVKRSGNRTVLFPLCLEGSTKVFPGVITYEE